MHQFRFGKQEYGIYLRSLNQTLWQVQHYDSTLLSLYNGFFTQAEITTKYEYKMLYNKRLSKFSE